jgi:formylglycine-generating enzyme required for sulfatase activity
MARSPNSTPHYRKLLIAAFIPFLSLALWVSSTQAFAAKSLAASKCARLLESYADRPAILEVKPQRHPQLNSNWAEMKKAHLEATAQLVEMYPHEEIYFLARDSELLYDIAMLMTQGEPGVQARLHLVNVSRANMNHAELKAYLEQEGVTEAKLASGKKFIFIDTGFAGTIPNKIQQLYPREMRPQLRTHLISSNNPSHPSTRVFLTMLNREAANRDPSQFHGTIVNYEHMPRYFDRSTGFEYRDGKLHPVSPVGSQVDGSVSKEVAKQYMEDLSAFAGEQAQKSRFQQMRQLWRELYGLASWGQKERLVQKLSELVASHDPFNEAVVRDFVEILQRNQPQTTENASTATLRYELTGESSHRRIEFTAHDLEVINAGGSSLKKTDISPELSEKLELLSRSEAKPNLKTVPVNAQAEKDTVVMLDLDDTLLKEVDFKDKSNGNVQAIRYRPSTETYQRYQQRAKAAAAPGKVFHYELHSDQTLTGYVVVNPEFVQFFDRLKGAIQSGKVRILATSSNDAPRTKAVVEQLKIEGRTLSEWGVEFVDKDQFQSSGGGRSFAKLRQALHIDEETRIVAIDDMPDQYQGVSSQDQVIGVQPWDLARSQSYLKNPAGFKQSDQTKSGLGALLDGYSASEPVQSQTESHGTVTGAVDFLQSLARRLFGVDPSSQWQIHSSYRREAPTTVSLQDLSLSEIQGSTVKNQKLSLAQKYPEWAPVLEDPQTKIPELLKAQDFGKLGALMDIYFDHEFYQLVFQNLGKLDLENANAQLGGFLKAIPKILKNHFQPAGEQVTQLVDLKAPKRVMLEYMREGENLKTSLMSSGVKVKQAAVDAVFTAANQREEFAGFRFLSERPETEWANLAKDYLYYTGGQERLTRDLLESFASTDTNVKRFAEQVLAQVDSKEYPFKEVLTDIQSRQEQYNRSFEDASRDFLQESAVSTARKTDLVLSQMGMKGSKFQEYLDYASGAERQDILDEIDRRTGLGPYLKLAQEKGVLSFFIEHTKLESVSFHTFTFPKNGKIYTLGSPKNEPGRSSNETQRKVTMKKSFALKKAETSQIEYALVMEDNPSKFKTGGVEIVINGKKILVDPTRPVDSVSYKDAEKFHRRMSLIDPKFNWDLPTESRWEVAAREGAKNPTDAYWFGNDPNEVWVYARTYENSYKQNHPLAQKPGDRNGLRDMAGLQWEWTKDWYADRAEGGVDPEGPSAGSARVLRGGSCRSDAQLARSAARGRGSDAPDSRDFSWGFRSVRTPK